MDDFCFADRYAEAGIAPTAQTIASRQAPAERIVVSATSAQILDLVGIYYGSPGLALTWLRDEFAKEDPTFSLVLNERETRVLAAAILGALVANQVEIAVLSVIVGSVSGQRPPLQAEWLLRNAEGAHGKIAVDQRKPSKVNAQVTHTTTPKLADEIAGLVSGDWATLLSVLAKIRTESQSSAKATSTQISAALSGLSRQIQLQREESQMLWWLVGGHSRSLSRGFATFSAPQAALVGALDLGALTTVTELGPVAAPAMLERIISLAKKPKGAVQTDIAGAIDGLARDDLEKLPASASALPPRLAPISAALALARSAGAGAWHIRFQEVSGFAATLEFEPTVLATQLYRESLLGQLL